jgi:predicted acylesterase/phospholipase RssA
MVEGAQAVEGLTGPVGIVLAGAVAQGAFEAGALGMLARKNPDMKIRRVAGTSSGSLNAAVAAVGVATGQFQSAAVILQKLWEEDGSFGHIARGAPRTWGRWFSDVIHRRGFLETTQLENLVKRAVAELMVHPKEEHDVTLTVVTTNLNATSPGDGVPLPRFEEPVVFRKKELVSRQHHELLAKAAAASATFPILFAPTLFADRHGTRPNPCIDGGAVNNAPISYVLREPKSDGRRADRAEEPDIKSVIVVTTESPKMEWKKDLGGLALASRVASALIDERIAYDLAEVLETNARHEKLKKALDALRIPESRERNSIIKAAGCWPINLYLVHPNSPLPGDAFSGFLEPGQRRQYVELGGQAKMIQLSVGAPSSTQPAA